MPNIDLDQLRKIRIKFTMLNIVFGMIASYMMLRTPVEKAGEMMFVSLGITLIVVVSSLAIGSMRAMVVAG